MSVGKYWLGLFLFCVGVVRGQGNTPERLFLQYLSEANKVETMHAYLMQHPWTDSDTLHLYRAMWALQQEQAPLFFTELEQSEFVFSQHQEYIGRASCSFLQSPALSSYAQRWFDWVNLHAPDSANRLLLHVYYCDSTAQHYSNWPGELPLKLKKYQEINRKKPVWSALFSACLPGSGSIYNQQTVTGISQFVFNGLLIAQAYESTRRLGIRHPLTWITVSMAGAFYSAGIYGAIRDLKQKKRAQQRAIYHYAADYYGTVFYRHYF
jgi:hypothetical protein